MRGPRHDEDDDEFIPFGIRNELREAGTGKRKRRFNSWLGEEEEEEEDGDGSGELPASYREALAAMGLGPGEGAGGGGGGFVAGGALDEQLKEEKAREQRARASKSDESGKKMKSERKLQKETATVIKDGQKMGSMGLNLLQKLGWKGGGLGKDGKGITAVLDVKVRPGGAGVGAIEEKTETQKKLERQRRMGLESDSDEDAPNEDKDEDFTTPGSGRVREDRSDRWRKKAAAKKVIKPQVRSAYDVMLEEARQGDASNPASDVVTIIDLTGPGERVVADVRQLSQKERRVDDYRGGIARELRFNLDKLADLAEADLKHKSRRVAQLQRRADTFQGQQVQLTEQLAGGEKILGSVKEAEAMVERLAGSAEAMAQVGAADLVQKLVGAFQGAKKRFGVELFQSLRFPDLLFALLEPALMRFFQVEHGERSREVVGPLRDFWVGSPVGDAVDVDLWEFFLHRVVIPPLEDWLSRGWDVKKDVHKAVEAVAVWSAEDADVRHRLLDEVVWHRIMAAVDAWDPLTDSIAIHEWLHPWLPLLSARFESLVYPVLVRKLVSALAEWDPLDETAFALLHPWRHCFSEAQRETLAQARLLPKLTSLCSTKLVCRPGQQPPRDVLEAVLVWHEWIPAASFLRILARSVFPRIYRSAFDWLVGSVDKSGQCLVTGRDMIEWYQTLKGTFPLDLVSEPKVSILFAHLLDVMVNVAVDRNSDFAPEVLLVDLWAGGGAGGAATVETGKETAKAPVGPSQASESLSFRAMVESFASSHGILFAPLVNKTRQGKPLYSFGGVNVYLANQLVYAEQAPGKWSVVSLDHLAQMVQPVEPADFD